MTKPKPKKTAAKSAIADVAHPGTSAPADTSKSIITQRPMIKDPMMVKGDGNPKTDDKPLPAKNPEAKLIPPDEQVADIKAESKESEPESESDDPPKPEPKSTDTAGDNTTPEDAGEKPEQSEDAAAADQAEPEEDPKIKKLIDDKKYFLPINAVEHRRSARFTAVGIVLALVLAVVWVDVALDAGLIHLGGIKPVTHLFSN